MFRSISSSRASWIHRPFTRLSQMLSSPCPAICRAGHGRCTSRSRSTGSTSTRPTPQSCATTLTSSLRGLRAPLETCASVVIFQLLTATTWVRLSAHARERRPLSRAWAPHGCAICCSRALPSITASTGRTAAAVSQPALAVIEPDERILVGAQNEAVVRVGVLLLVHDSEDARCARAVVLVRVVPCQLRGPGRHVHRAARGSEASPGSSSLLCALAPVRSWLVSRVVCGRPSRRVALVYRLQ
jgi:hypothetical protein